jgi:hypothetical protein
MRCESVQCMLHAEQFLYLLDLQLQAVVAPLIPRLGLPNHIAQIVDDLHIRMPRQIEISQRHKAQHPRSSQSGAGNESVAMLCRSCGNTVVAAAGTLRGARPKRMHCQHVCIVGVRAMPKPGGDGTWTRRLASPRPQYSCSMCSSLTPSRCRSSPMASCSNAVATSHTAGLTGHMASEDATDAGRCLRQSRLLHNCFVNSAAGSTCMLPMPADRPEALMCTEKHLALTPGGHALVQNIAAVTCSDGFCAASSRRVCVKGQRLGGEAYLERGRRRVLRPGLAGEVLHDIAAVPDAAHLHPRRLDHGDCTSPNRRATGLHTPEGFSSFRSSGFPSAAMNASAAPTRP